MTKKDASLAPVPPSAMTIRLSPLAGIVMALFLLSGLCACLWAMLVSHSVDWLPKQVNWQVLRDGDITHHIAKELSHVELARKAADLERAGSWLLLGDTGPRVRQGCPGWLFLADENRIHRHAQSNAQARADKVVAVRDWLAQRQIALQVVLVPDKSRIAAQQLCTLLRPAQLQARAEQWQALLKNHGVAVLDLAPSLKPLGGSAFLRSDSHWSEAGAQAAALALAEQVKRTGVTATPSQSLARSLLPQALRPGDLVRLAGLDWLPQTLQPAADYVQASSFSQSSQGEALSEEDLFGDSQLPNVALIGTSFSRNSNFVAFLEQALGASLGNFAKDGGEFAGAAKDYFASPAFQQTPPQLLIWEIPERDLQPAFVDDLLLPAQ
ncbi:alginate O-acetyltransferase AlgX-related protein [Pseudomonas sp. 5P_3.1_Bac2]|uniref:alginate O-acetyltransferase AlgX-related protein n=1 Tax=Pseudomonas sp. 5P_3.1_Bac2 TaxID=2971617 RepID=UPI0021CA4FCB|nr:cell division protein FtsQ [Pseudomonas sp. 5P_3.1_Bac2]MCU1717236.1 cell division protein FtsQ [Pseudomonas sp. 5P_3.1_Bac2]